MKKMLVYVAAFASVVLLGVGISPNVNAVGLNNFTISSYQIDYYLDRDSSNHSTLKTVEKIVAEFPSFDQNHGIERYVPQSYDNHSTNLSIASVTDESGLALSYTTYISNDNKVIRIGDANQYVHGTKTYVITYNQQDVTRYFDNTKRDEFYWDTNGTGWGVPIVHLSVTLHIGGGISSSLSNNNACYVGVQGSNTPCDVLASPDGFVASADDLQPKENLTVAIGFKPQTFAAYTQSIQDIFKIYWVFCLVILSPIIAITLMIILGVWAQSAYNRRKDVGTIVPEYLPPSDASVTVSATIYNKPMKAFSAQLIDFAVRHYIKIYQISEKSIFKRAEYELEIIKDISDLRDEEREILTDMFDSVAIGSRFSLKDMEQNRTLFYIRFKDNIKKLNTNIRGRYGLRAKDPSLKPRFIRLGTIGLVLAILTISPLILTVSIMAYITAWTLWPLTDKGVELRRYLEGLKMYISVAEVDRLKMLQSPEGAEKIEISIDANDKGQLVKLYERVLPYAILFNQEKGWNNQLGAYYESINQAPEWYVGQSAVFNAAVFSSAMNSFSQTVSYAGASNSSTGGSGGGGSSGGGGGGGGGGGW